MTALQVITGIAAIAAVYLPVGAGAAALLGPDFRRRPILWPLGSCLVLPFAFHAAGLVRPGPLTPTRVALVIAGTALLLFVGAAVARRSGWQAAPTWPRPRPPKTVFRRQDWLLAGLIGGTFVVLVIAARLAWQTGRLPSIGDEPWQFLKLVAMTVSGIPPQHYLSSDRPASPSACGRHIGAARAAAHAAAAIGHCSNSRRSPRGQHLDQECPSRQPVHVQYDLRYEPLQDHAFHLL